jgi:hypothetical protein
MEVYYDEDDLHNVAAHGSASDILAIIDCIKMSAPMVFEDRIIASLNKRNQAKYTPLHCAIFGR